MCRPFVKYIDFNKVSMTMTQVIREVEKLKIAHPDQEIFMDGDEYAIIGRARA